MCLTAFRLARFCSRYGRSICSTLARRLSMKGDSYFGAIIDSLRLGLEDMAALT